MRALILDQRLGILPSPCLEINSLGDTASRTNYRTALVAHFTAHRSSLSAESRDRLERNHYAFLIHKDEGDRALVGNAPAFADHLNAESQNVLFDRFRKI